MQNNHWHMMIGMQNVLCNTVQAKHFLLPGHIQQNKMLEWELCLVSDTNSYPCILIITPFFALSNERIYNLQNRQNGWISGRGCHKSPTVSLIAFSGATPTSCGSKPKEMEEKIFKNCEYILYTFTMSLPPISKHRLYVRLTAQVSTHEVPYVMFTVLLRWRNSPENPQQKSEVKPSDFGKIHATK